MGNHETRPTSVGRRQTKKNNKKHNTTKKTKMMSNTDSSKKNWGLSQGSYKGLEVPASYKTPCLASGKENSCLEKLRTFENVVYSGFPPALL